MTKRKSTVRILFWVALIWVVLWGINLPLQFAARPPKGLETIADFKDWKPSSTRNGTFEHSGETFTVMFGPAGRFLPSGPSAYLFNKNGDFIDWTPDMGDCYTIKHKFNLTGGNVKNIIGSNPYR